VACDGSTFAFGYGEDPRASEYGFARMVDYGSAACLLVRRSAFTHVGGFDPVFGTGYCEDVDFALTLAAHGMLTVYEPSAVVSHLRHGSSSEADAEAGVRANRSTLMARWWHRIARHPPLEELERFPHRVVALRDSPVSETLLIVDEEGHPQSWVLALVARWPTMRITLVAPQASTHDADVCRRAGIEVVTEADDWPSWFAARRFHYSIVVARAGCDPDLARLIGATQPQATRVDAPGDSVANAIAALGVLPRRPSGATIPRLRDTWNT